jgi:serine phosphatase RsbU (regulator of sigma subunit)
MAKDLERALERCRQELAAATAGARNAEELERSLQQQLAATRGLGQLLATKVSEVRSVRASLVEKTRELGRQAVVGLLVEAGALEPVAASVLQTICENLDWDAAVLWRVDEGSKELLCLETWTVERHRERHADFLARLRTTTFREGVDLPGRAWKTRTTATVLDLVGEKSSARAELAGEAGLHSACALPVLVDRRVGAVIELFSRDWRPLDPNKLEPFDALGRQIGRMVELQRAKQQMHLGELSVARRVQTSILPRTLEAEGFDIAARMLPAEEVGGDYYDVLPQAGGCWIAIGDVTGHGISAGIVMVMVQSATAALVNAKPDAAPRDVVRHLNLTLFQNIRERLGGDDHVTYSVLRCHSDGRFAVAGAHEEILVYRARTRRCERVQTPGTWLGAARDISAVTVDTSYELEPGDVLVLHTDGLTEARNAVREMFGMDRLAEVIERHHAERPEEIRDRIFEAVLAFSPERADDITVLVARYRSPAERNRTGAPAPVR